MTNRDFFKAIINANLNEEVTAHAERELERLDAKNEKRKNTPTKNQKENEGIMNTIVATLTAKGKMFASEIATTVGISTQKVSGLCKLLVDSNRIKVKDVKVKNKGTLKQYSVVETVDEVADEE